jgi:hypothetical protein
VRPRVAYFAEGKAPIRQSRYDHFTPFASHCNVRAIIGTSFDPETSTAPEYQIYKDSLA